MKRNRKTSGKAADEKSSSLPFLKIKDAHLLTVVAYNKSGKPLGQRSNSDLIDLAILAHQSKSKTLLGYFEILPPLSELQREKLSHHVHHTQKNKQ